MSNKLLSLLLVVLSFRIGKSVFLEFTPNLDVKIIFIGLGTIFALGPLYYLFVRTCIDKSFKIRSTHFFHFIPFVLGVIFGFWINDSHTSTLPMLFFVSVFASYYLHFLIYLIIGYSYAQRKKAGLNQEVNNFIKLLFFGFLAIWIVYVLNIFDEDIPYIIGPILYSLVAYTISFIVIKKGYINKIDQTKYQTTSISDEQSNDIYQNILHLMGDEHQYKDPNLTLKSLSQRLKVTTQVLSMVVNQKSQQNFNSFINSFRVKESLRLFNEQEFNNRTIAAIAFEVGFNSISSFNSAFKKQTGKTPLTYRNQIAK
ncbi:MAG TPA: helix-turn-helix domain-containing protein [Fulvivirga sp.]|nr:helix-turn-helix domain-containing protein [Fulvivirga sp.]